MPTLLSHALIDPPQRQVLAWREFDKARAAVGRGVCRQVGRQD